MGSFEATESIHFCNTNTIKREWLPYDSFMMQEQHKCEFVMHLQRVAGESMLN